MKKALKVSTVTRLTLLSTVVIILIGIFNGVQLANSMNRLVNLNDEKALATGYGRQLSDASDFLTEMVRSYCATADKKYYDDYWAEVNTTKRRENSIEELTALGITDEEMNHITQMKAASDKLVPLEEQAMAEVENNNLTKALSYVYGSDYQSGKDIVSSNGTAFNEKIETRYTKKIEALSSDIHLQIIILDILLVFLLLEMFVNHLITRKKIVLPISILADSFEKVSKGNLSVETDLEEDTSEIGILTGTLKSTQKMLQTYIHDISNNLKKMSNNDLTIHIDREYIGDFIEIKNAINGIGESMRNTIQKIDVNADHVYSIANQVSEVAQSIADGTSEQASSIENLAGSIHDLTSQVKNNVSNAAEALAVVTLADTELTDSGKHMQEMVDAMNEISNSSSEIGKIIKTIEDIAFQTNILALNAAVEAARAGAAGKGFAVVADEVRNLASKSAEAASNTASLIQASISSVESGTQIANNTANSMMVVIDSAKNVMSVVDKISAESEKQSVTIDEINRSVDQISAVVQKNSAVAEEGAATSQTLSSQAEILKSQASQFKLNL